jgi:transcriptional regulator with XRE-family HTH domain
MPPKGTPLPHLRRLRAARGLSRGQLARAAGVGPTTVHGLETWSYGATPATIARLARALGVQEVDLVGPEALETAETRRAL